MEFSAIKVVQPNAEILDLLREYDRKGGVLDFVFFSHQGTAANEQMHRQAPHMTLIEAQSRMAHWVDSRVAPDPAWRDKLLQLTIPNGYSPIGRKITVSEFLGPLYSNQAGFQPKPNGSISGEEMNGFAYAFTKPPYQLHDAERLFLEFKESLFLGYPDTAAIWQWETDDLSYFDAGREWWGTFFWTYQATSTSQLIGVMGSTTD